MSVERFDCEKRTRAIRFLPPLCIAHKKADPKVEDRAEDAEDSASRVKHFHVVQLRCHKCLCV